MSENKAFTGLAEVVNITDAEARIRISTQPGSPPIVHKVPPGGSVEIPAGYCVRRGSEGRDQLPPIVEDLTLGAVVPASDPRAKAKKAATAAAKK